MLFKLAQTKGPDGKPPPAKYFSIDRVFRNESVDATHLAEFHQGKPINCVDFLTFMSAGPWRAVFGAILQAEETAKPSALSHKPLKKELIHWYSGGSSRCVRPNSWWTDGIHESK